MRRWVTGVLIATFVAGVLLPMVWVWVSSLKSGPEILAHPWSLPENPKWENYGTAWEKAGIGRYFLNSLLATAGSLALLIPIGAMAAYVLARFPFWGSKAIFTSFLAGMMVPQFLAIVPLFFLMSRLGLFDTRQGLIIAYVAYSLSFTIFVLTGFFHQLPRELEEAAEMDGCSEYRTFWSIMLPLAKPGILVVTIFNAIGLWNEYSLALVLVPSDANRTLPLGVANLVIVHQYQSDWGALFAALSIVMTPVLVVYLIFREKIHQTMLAGALKG